MESGYLFVMQSVRKTNTPSNKHSFSVFKIYPTIYESWNGKISIRMNFLTSAAKISRVMSRERHILSVSVMTWSWLSPANRQSMDKSINDLCMSLILNSLWIRPTLGCLLADNYHHQVVIVTDNVCLSLNTTLLIIMARNRNEIRSVGQKHTPKHAQHHAMWQQHLQQCPAEGGHDRMTHLQRLRSRMLMHQQTRPDLCKIYNENSLKKLHKGKNDKQHLFWSSNELFTAPYQELSILECESKCTRY